MKFFENENSEPEVIKNNKYFRKYPLFTLNDEEKQNQQKFNNPESDKYKQNSQMTAKLARNSTAERSYKKWTESFGISQNSQLKNISFDDYCTLWKGELISVFMYTDIIFEILVLELGRTATIIIF